jgi:hypothetical protein
MTDYTFEPVSSVAGAYISWGSFIGQEVVGKVVGYDAVGGRDFAENPCPQLQIDLVHPAKSINKEGVITDFDAGEIVVLNCGQVSLKRAIRAADPAPGDVIKITLSNLVKTKNGQVKEFDVAIARGAGKSAVPAAAPVQAGNPFGGAPAAAPSANPFA